MKSKICHKEAFGSVGSFLFQIIAIALFAAFYLTYLKSLHVISLK